MSDEDAPWTALLANFDDDNSRTATQNQLSALLSDEATGPRTAAIVAPLLKTLKTPKGRIAGMNALQPFIQSVTAVRDLALNLADDEEPEVRVTALHGLLLIPNDPDAKSRMSTALQDTDPRVREIAINSFGTFLSASAQPPNATLSLHVLPTPEMRQEAISVLDRLERALETLRDLGGLEEAQLTILSDIVFPAIRELRALLQAEAPDNGHAQELRKQGIVKISALSGAAKAMLAAAPTTITAIAEGDKAIQNVTKAVEALYPHAEMLFSLISKQF